MREGHFLPEEGPERGAWVPGLSLAPLPWQVAGVRHQLPTWGTQGRGGEHPGGRKPGLAVPSLGVASAFTPFTTIQRRLRLSSSHSTFPRAHTPPKREAASKDRPGQPLAWRMADTRRVIQGGWMLVRGVCLGLHPTMLRERDVSCGFSLPWIWDARPSLAALG